MSAPTARAGVVHVMAPAFDGVLRTQWPHLAGADFARRALAFAEAAGLRVVPVIVLEALVEAMHALSALSGDAGTQTEQALAKVRDALRAASPFAPPKETQE